MRGREEVINSLKEGLSISSADEVELLFLGKESILTRYANSTIHQNVKESNSEIRVRVVIGKKIGFSQTNDL